MVQDEGSEGYGADPIPDSVLRELVLSGILARDRTQALDRNQKTRRA